MKQKLQGVSQTLLFPLYARYSESKRDHPAFIDKTAINIVNNLDFDYSQFNKRINLSIWGCAARTLIFDNAVTEYIQKYPDASVINIACGFDDRFARVDNGIIHWHNIDFPEIIKYRKEFIAPHDRQIDIACSALDYTWMKKIHPAKTTLIIAEGILMYFTDDEIKDLFLAIHNAFPHTVLFLEFCSKWIVRNNQKHDVKRQMNVSFKSGVDSIQDFINLCPDYRPVKEINFTDAMKPYAPILMTFMGLWLRNKNNRLCIYES